MSEPLMVRICDEGHVNDVRMEPGCEWCYGTTRLVRVFREEDVRPLWEGAHQAGSTYDGSDEWNAGWDKINAFPAPEDWTS